ncbi:Pleckstrin homology-like domain [Globisporangium polare]
MVTPDLLVDLALLSSLSVLVHYFFGLYGIVAAVAGVSLLEHGAEIVAAALDKVSRYGGSKSEIAKQAVDSIRRRRPTRTRGANGEGVAWRNDQEVYENDREPVDENDGEEDEARDADPRALLEQFSIVASDGYESEPLDRTSQRDDVVSEDSSQSSDDLASRLVIRNIGSRYTVNEDSAHTEAAARDQPMQDPGDTDRGDQPDDHQQQTSFVSAHTTTTNSLMQMNSREPIAFETDLFRGHVYFLVRTSPEDPHWSRLFSGRRRMFWIQVQGRFKRAPRGTVYLGGELPAQISPGIFTRSIAHVIMGIIQQLVGSVNFSFGDASNEVLPSIALPLFQSADQLIVTPAGQQPPPLGERDFGESDAARRLRRQTPVGSESYVVGDTYSFDFHTMYVDLTRWRTANLPGLSEMELSTFFDSLPLRMVAYEVCATPSERHLQAQKDYLFKFEVQYDRRGRHSYNSRDGSDVRTQRRRGPLLLERAESGTSEDTMSVPEGVASSTDGSGGMSTVVSETSSFDDQTLVLDEVLFLNQENARRMAKLSFSYLYWLEEVDVASGIRRVHYVFAVRRNRSAMEPEPGGVVQNQHQLAVVSAYGLRVLLLGRSSSSHKQKKQSQALQRMSTMTSKDFSELQLLSSLRFHSQSRIGCYSTISDEAFVVAQCLERLVRQKTQSFLVREDDDDDVGDESLDNELSDRDLVTSLPLASHLAADEDAAFLSSLYQCLTQRSQLQAPQSTNASCSPSKLGVNLSKREREDMRVVFEGVVYRYHSESLLRQEVLFITPDELLFYRSYSASAEKHVACGRVIGVRAIQLPAGPFEVDERCAFVFQVSTFAEEIVLCVGTEYARATWMRVLAQHCQPQKNLDDAALSHSNEEQMHICYASSKPLKPAGRIMLNSRALFPGRCQPTGANRSQDQGSTATATTDKDALHVVKKALRLALQIHGRRVDERVTVVETLAFLNAASALRLVDLDQVQRELSHETQLAFYLNLYHVVLAHAMISHGFPRGKSQWDFFLTHMCYSVGLRGASQQVSLSLADIEHVLLRKRMAQADLPHLSFSNLLHRNGLHIARLKGLGVAHPDFRLIFALAMNQQVQQDKVNNVVVYEPELVHDQLNAVAQAALRDVTVEKSTTNGDRSTIKLLLPRVCEWYRLDFGGGGSPLHCVRKLLGFLSEELQHRVLEALEDPLATKVKFRSFKYAPKARLQQVELREGRLRPVVVVAAAAAAAATTQATTTTQ